MNIYLISSIVIISVILLSIILYFVLKPHNKPVIHTCGDKTQCGTGCYDKSWQSCDKNKQICDSKNFSQDSDRCCISPENLHDKIQVDDKGNKKIVGKVCCQDEYWSSIGNVCCPNPVCGGFCCENVKYCDYSIVDDNEKNNKNNSPCVQCPYDLCGKNCCLSDEKCFTGPSGNISCCNPQLWDPDKLICCNGSTGAVVGIDCHPGGFPKCNNTKCNDQQTCISNDICCDNVYDANNKAYNCVDQNFYKSCCPKDGFSDKCKLTKTGQYMCCEDGFSFDEKTQKCLQICGNEKCDPNLFTCVGTNEYQYCQTKGCEWNTSSGYNPPNFGNSIIFSYTGSDGPKYYYALPTDSDISKKLHRTISFVEGDKYNKCNEKDCQGKINEKGASSVFDIKNHNCIGTYNYNIIPSITTKPPCPYYGSCVEKDGNLTGQICLNSQGIPQKPYSGPTMNFRDKTISVGDCICNETDNMKTDHCINPILNLGDQNGSKWIISVNNKDYEFTDHIDGQFTQLIDSNDPNGQSFSYVPRMKLSNPKNNQYIYDNVESDDNSFIIIHINVPTADKYGMNDLGQWGDNANSYSFTFNSEKGVYESINTSTIIYQKNLFE